MDEEASCGRYKRSSHRIGQQVEGGRVGTWAEGGITGGRRRSISEVREGCGHDARLTCGATSCLDLIAFLPLIRPAGRRNFCGGRRGDLCLAGPYFLRRPLPPGGDGRAPAGQRRELPNWCGAGDGDATGIQSRR
jgi:hypothetical protein